MPKKQTAFVSRFFVWDAGTEKWAQSTLKQAEERRIKFEHWKSVQGRLWCVCSHPQFPDVYFGMWEDDGPHVPPYA